VIKIYVKYVLRWFRRPF